MKKLIKYFIEINSTIAEVDSLYATKYHHYNEGHLCQFYQVSGGIIKWHGLGHGKKACWEYYNQETQERFEIRKVVKIWREEW